MMITAWRITRKKHAAEAFSGQGAKEFGGRWNPPGTAAVYTSDSLSLAILELIVHLDDDSDIGNYVAIPIQFDDSRATRWPISELPKNWMHSPVPVENQQLGKDWIDSGKSMVLQVPSAVVPQQYNYVINALHPEFRSAIIGSPLVNPINTRLIKNSSKAML